MATLICPLCRDTCLERLLTVNPLTVAVTVTAFQCAGNGHIFYVRTTDASGWPKMKTAACRTCGHSASLEDSQVDEERELS